MWALECDREGEEEWQDYSHSSIFYFPLVLPSLYTMIDWCQLKLWAAHIFLCCVAAALSPLVTITSHCCLTMTHQTSSKTQFLVGSFLHIAWQLLHVASVTQWKIVTLLLWALKNNGTSQFLTINGTIWSLFLICAIVRSYAVFITTAVQYRQEVATNRNCRMMAHWNCFTSQYPPRSITFKISSIGESNGHGCIKRTSYPAPSPTCQKSFQTSAGFHILESIKQFLLSPSLAELTDFLLAHCTQQWHRNDTALRDFGDLTSSSVFQDKTVSETSCVPFLIMCILPLAHVSVPMLMLNLQK